MHAFRGGDDVAPVGQPDDVDDSIREPCDVGQEVHADSVTRTDRREVLFDGSRLASALTLAEAERGGQHSGGSLLT